MSLVRGEASDGRLFIRCPWASEHTSEGDITATVYFPAGTNGYETGSFLCLHSHCHNRSNADFLDALGWTLEGFEPIDEGRAALHSLGIQDADDLIGDSPTVENVQPLHIRPIDRDTKSGIVKPVLPAVVAALERPDLVGAHVSFDAFTDDLYIQWRGTDRRTILDEDFTRLRLALIKGHRFDAKLSRELVMESVALVAKDAIFDAGIELANSLPAWDGQTRVADFYRVYLGVTAKETQSYAAACSRYLWTALAGRLLVPGIKADMAPIWVGPQGSGKTSAVRALALKDDHYVELDISEPDNDLSRRIKGKTVAELSELRGLRSREIEQVKSFISRPFENYVEKYAKRPHNYYRRLILVGTSNRDDFLMDDTGNRRFLPVQVGRHQNFDGIIRDREQLWAEALLTFKKEGILWQQAEDLARGVHEEYMSDDDWMPRIDLWLDVKDLDGRSPRDKGEITTLEIATGAFHMNSQDITPAHTRRLASCLRRLGYMPKMAHQAVSHRCYRVWVPR